MQIAMSSAIDYDKLGDVIVSKLEKADITAVLDSDKAYQVTVKKWRQEANRTQRNPVPIFKLQLSFVCGMVCIIYYKWDGVQEKVGNSNFDNSCGGINWVWKRI